MRGLYCADHKKQDNLINQIRETSNPKKRKFDEISNTLKANIAEES